MSGKIKAIFWDNDGVLVDTERLYCRATRELLAEHGVMLSDAQYAECFLLDSRGAWHLLGNPGPEEIERLRGLRNDRYAKYLESEAAVTPGIAELIASLEGRVRMAVVSSSRRDHLLAAHAGSGLLRCFDFILTCEDCKRTKPDPELYLRAVERSGLAACECLAIEDSPRGVLAAKRAGLRCWVLRSELCSTLDFSAAERIIDSAAELGSLLQREL